MTKSLQLLSLLLIFSPGCIDNNTEKALVDSPTSGELTIMVEKGFEPVIASAITVFDSTYPQAKIHASYVSEVEAIKGLINQDALLIVSSRKLTPAELIPFKNRRFEPEQTCIAYDALALIMHPSNSSQILTEENVKDIMAGRLNKWSDLDPENKAGDILMVFDNQNSSTVRYAIDSINSGNSLPSNATALKNNEEVIQYVAKSKNAIGIISNNWISDTDDKGAQTFLNSVGLMAIAKTKGAEAFTPHQAYLYTNEYPYKRAIYAINAQPRAKGLGRGFASFLAGPVGQLIMYKDGLLPYRMQPRLISVEQK